MEIKAANAEETIRCILDEEKMTQQDLADRMGITRQNISQSLNRNAKSMRYAVAKYNIYIIKQYLKRWR